MTLDAILKVLDAFFQMFSFDLGWLVFVTAITGVAAKFILDMAGHTSSVVVLVQYEQLVMLERCGFPRVLVVALLAIARNLTVQAVSWCLVATFALFAYRRAKELMRERLATALGEPWSLVIAVAGHAVLLDQVPMEGSF